MDGAAIAKGLEVWTLQTLLNVSIMLGFLSMGLILAQPYYDALKKHLTLRVSIELWNVFTVLLADIFLVLVVLIGFLILNPDIMADIKIAVPFVPAATVLFAIGLVLRLFYDGHQKKSPRFKTALWFVFTANLINIIGFSFIMEAPSGEYLSLHPSPFWTFIKTHLRSNASPHGLEMAQLIFYLFFPILLGIFIWGFVRALKMLTNQND